MEDKPRHKKPTAAAPKITKTVAPTWTERLDTKLKSYCLRHQLSKGRGIAWKKVVQEMNISQHHCKQRWNDLKEIDEPEVEFVCSGYSPHIMDDNYSQSEISNLASHTRSSSSKASHTRSSSSNASHARSSSSDTSHTRTSTRNSSNAAHTNSSSAGAEANSGSKLNLILELLQQRDSTIDSLQSQVAELTENVAHLKQTTQQPPVVPDDPQLLSRHPKKRNIQKMQQQTDDNVTSSDEEGQPTEHRKKKNRQHRRKNTSRTTGGVWMNRADVRMVQMNASQVAEISQLRQDTYLNLMMESKQD